MYSRKTTFSVAICYESTVVIGGIEPLKAQWLLYLPPAITFNNAASYDSRFERRLLPYIALTGRSVTALDTKSVYSKAENEMSYII